MPPSIPPSLHLPKVHTLPAWANAMPIRWMPVLYPPPQCSEEDNKTCHSCSVVFCSTSDITTLFYSTGTLKTSINKRRPGSLAWSSPTIRRPTPPVGFIRLDATSSDNLYFYRNIPTWLYPSPSTIAIASHFCSVSVALSTTIGRLGRADTTTTASEA